MDYLVPLIAGYAVGSLPIGFVLTRWLSGIDLRQAGSGNVGATNVYRTAGAGLAIVVAGVDVAKGVVSVLIASRLTSNGAAPVISGVAAIVGHLFPAWLRFRGGKGVATACGVFGLLAPVATLWATAAFLLTVTTTRYVSLGSMVASLALPPLAWATEAPTAVVAGGAIAGLLIVVKHRANLARLAAGTERRLPPPQRLWRTGGRRLT